MSADPGQPPPDGDNAGRPNLNRLSGQYSAPPGPNGHGSPAPEARHMKDLQAEARRRVAQLSSSSIPKLLRAADESVSLSGSLLNHRRRDQAYVEFLVAYEIMVNQIPRHREYPTMKTSKGQNLKLNDDLLRSVNSNVERFEKIKEIIVYENTRSGALPRQDASHQHSQSQQLSPEAQRPLSRTSGTMPGELKTSPPGNGGSFVRSPRASPAPNANALSPSPKPRPVVRPKPEGLHGNAIHQPRISLNGTYDPLTERFSKLRNPASVANHSRNGSVVSSSSTGSTPARMPSPTDYKPAPPTSGTQGGVPLSLRPAGPRSMPKASSPAPPPKLPLDTQLAAAMPKPPSPTYSPARNMQTPIGMNPPRTSARSILGTGGRSNSMAASSASSRAPGHDADTGSYFPTISGQATSNGSRRQGIIGLPNEMRVLTANRLFDYLRMYDILLIDVRSREEFDTGHIDSSRVMCIEPLELRQGISAEDIQSSLSIAPDLEQGLFNERDRYDLVVYYDQSTTNDNYLRSAARNPAEEALKILYEALTEYNYEKPLKTPPPILLQGGITAWEDLLGRAALRVSDTANTKSSKSTPRTRESIQMPVPSQYLTVSKERKRRGGYNPLNAEEERLWAERARTESMYIAPLSNIDDNEEVQDEGDAAFFRSQEEFFRRYPAVPLEQQSMVSPPPRIDSISPRPYPQAPAYPLMSSHEVMPVRPQPTASRPVNSGAHDIDYTAPHIPGRTQHLREYIPQRDMPHNIRLPRTGLYNPGWTCYMNAVIQCLSATLPLTKIFRDNSYKKYIQRDNDPASRGLFPAVYANLVQHLWVGSTDFIKPSTFRDFCARLNPELWGSSQQQDAYEFFAFVLSYLHADLNINWANDPPHPLTPQEEAAREQMPLLHATNIEWGRYCKKDRSMVSDLFVGRHASRLCCLSCGQTSTTHESWNNISVEIPRSGRTTLEACLASYTHEEQLGASDGWECIRCHRRASTKKIILTRAPRYLVVHFKRFSASHDERARKIQTSVSFPLRGLDLGPYMLSLPSDAEVRASGRPLDESMTGPFRYDAYAVIRHLGSSIGHGHYVSLVKDRGRGRWRYFDDQKSSDFGESDVVMDDRVNEGGKAYIVFYERVGDLKSLSA